MSCDLCTDFLLIGLFDVLEQLYCLGQIRGDCWSYKFQVPDLGSAQANCHRAELM